MGAGAWMMTVAMLLAFGALAFLIFSTFRSIVNERLPGRGVWKDFGLGLGLMILFLGTWVAHGIAEWQVFTDQQREHGQSIEVGDFVGQFAQSTLENWQSEFLQLFSFVVLAALYIHRGSAESKEGDEKMEASLRRIEESLGTLPRDVSDGELQLGKLPDPPALRD
jgi:hypothetical protein